MNIAHNAGFGKLLIDCFSVDLRAIVGQVRSDSETPVHQMSRVK